MNRKFIYIFIILIFIFSCKKNIQRITGDDPSDPSNPMPVPPIVTPPSASAEDVWDGSIIEPNLINGNIYEINKSGELAWIARESNKDIDQRDFKDITIKLMANLDFQKNPDFNGIAVGGDINGDGTIDSFKGIFDGNGKKIINIIVKTNNYSGFIGRLEEGRVKNLGIEGAEVSGDWVVGGIVGNIYGSCAVVENSYYLGSVIGDGSTGGIAGHNNGGTIRNCYNSAIINGRGDSIGGIVGVNFHGIIGNCYNLEKIEGDIQIGGIAGNNDGGIIENCYNMNVVNGNIQVGVVVGNNHNSGNILRCFFIQMPGGINYGKNGIGAGTGSVEAKSYTDFKNQSTFSGWDFTSVWKMSLERPIFIWQ